MAPRRMAAFVEEAAADLRGARPLHLPLLRESHELEDIATARSTTWARRSPTIPVLNPTETALLVIDVQNTYLERPDRATLTPDEQQPL